MKKFLLVLLTLTGLLISEEAESKVMHSLDINSFYKKSHSIIFENIIGN